MWAGGYDNIDIDVSMDEADFKRAAESDWLSMPSTSNTYRLSDDDWLSIARDDDGDWPPWPRHFDDGRKSGRTAMILAYYAGWLYSDDWLPINDDYNICDDRERGHFDEAKITRV